MSCIFFFFVPLYISSGKLHKTLRTNEKYGKNSLVINLAFFIVELKTFSTTKCFNCLMLLASQFLILYWNKNYFSSSKWVLSAMSYIQAFFSHVVKWKHCRSDRNNKIEKYLAYCIAIAGIYQNEFNESFISTNDSKCVPIKSIKNRETLLLLTRVDDFAKKSCPYFRPLSR